MDGFTLVFVDESGCYLSPGRVRTYAPCGQTPILRCFQTRDHLSVMSGLTMAGQLYTRVREAALTSADSVGFLKHLLRYLGKVLVIWDSSPIHMGEVRDYLSHGAAAKVHLESLPAYAPLTRASGNTSRTLRCAICVVEIWIICDENFSVPSCAYG